jgi:hypothetical protein
MADWMGLDDVAVIDRGDLAAGLAPAVAGRAAASRGA